MVENRKISRIKNAKSKTRAKAHHLGLYSVPVLRGLSPLATKPLPAESIDILQENFLTLTLCDPYYHFISRVIIEAKKKSNIIFKKGYKRA